MLSLRKTAAGFGLDLGEAPEPAPPGPGAALVRVENAGICGSDVHAYEWSDGYGFMAPHLPVVMGHEFAGVVAAVGAGAGTLSPGQRVAVMPGIACGRCAACLRGEPRGCTRRATIGLTVNGGFARHVQVPAANCLPLPDAVDTELGALAEPLAVGCEGVLTAGIGLGETVLVMGPGTIGQALALMARAAGARVIVSGRADAPRFDVLRALGFAEVVDVAEAPLRDQVLARTGGAPVDAVLEATGIPATIQEGLGVLRKDGRLVAVGIHAAPLTLALTDFVRMRHRLLASHGAARATWDRVLALLARQPEGFRPMITHRLPLARGIEGFELARQRAASKVMLQP